MIATITAAEFAGFLAAAATTLIFVAIALFRS